MSHLRISVQSGIGCRSLSWVLRNSLLAVVQLVFGRRHFDALAGTAALLSDRLRSLLNNVE